jgi:hypothetical protein
MKENPNINDVFSRVIDGGLTVEEALNGFIDGELTPRQKTEIHRLVAHDQRVAQRLNELQNCRMLVSSLPYEEAPADMLENIKGCLEKKTLLGSDSSHLGRQNGARHLMARRLLSAAAMTALVAALGVVIYNIIGPAQMPKKAVVFEMPQQPVSNLKTKTAVQPVMAAEEKPLRSPVTAFNLRLELKTDNPSAVDAFISRAIEDKGISKCEIAKNNTSGTVHIIGCDKSCLKSLMADLESIWEKFDSAALSVQADHLETVVIGAVNARQVAEVVNQDTFERSVAMAKNFAALNNITGSLPGKEVLTAVAENKKADLTAVPKPVLTSSEKAVKKPAVRYQASEQVNLTIIVTSSK